MGRRLAIAENEPLTRTHGVAAGNHLGGDAPAGAYAFGAALPVAVARSPAVLRRLLVLLALSGFAMLAHAAGDITGGPTGNLLAHGAKDGAAPAWAITVASPAGWTRDCCVYARAIGVDAVLYQGEWSGKPQRVMVLNVSPRKLPTLAAEVQADRKRYHQLDPAGKITGFAVRQRTMPCQATVYQGTDHVDDVVVFCDPGQTSGVRLSWSITLDSNDPSRRALLDDFMRVVVASRYQPYVAPHGG